MGKIDSIEISKRHSMRDLDCTTFAEMFDALSWLPFHDTMPSSLIPSTFLTKKVLPNDLPLYKGVVARLRGILHHNLNTLC